MVGGVPDTPWARVLTTVAGRPFGIGAGISCSASRALSASPTAATSPDSSGSPQDSACRIGRHGRFRPVPVPVSSTNPCFASWRRCHEQFAGL